MIEERLTGKERRRIIALLIDAQQPGVRDRELTGLIKKLSGVDTVVKVERAEPSAPQKPASEVLRVLGRIENNDE